MIVMPKKPNRTKTMVSLWLDNAALKIWAAMPRGRRSEAVCKLMTKQTRGSAGIGNLKVSYEGEEGK